jgi:transposase
MVPVGPSRSGLRPGRRTNFPRRFRCSKRCQFVPGWVVGDRGYTSHRFREHIWNMGARPAIPPQRHEAPVACPEWVYNNRNRVERLWARLKEWRAVATRYEKTATSFLGVLCLAATCDWLKR